MANTCQKDPEYIIKMDLPIHLYYTKGRYLVQKWECLINQDFT